MSTYPVKIVYPNSDRIVGWTILQDTAMVLYPDEPHDKTIAMLEYDTNAVNVFSEEEVKEAMKEEFEHFKEDLDYNKDGLVEYYNDWFRGKWERVFGEALTEKEVRELIEE